MKPALDPISFMLLIVIDAHPQSQITGIAWLDNNTIVSVGQDCNTRYWDIRNFPWNATRQQKQKKFDQVTMMVDCY